MNAEQYCRSAEREERRRKQLLTTVSVREDHSPLVPLKSTGFPLMFEPSMVEDYDYRVREAIVEKIGRISRSLKAQDKILIIRSVWRSFEHQSLLWEKKMAVMRNDYPNRGEDEIHELVCRFIAAPEKSMHATGGAVDALIYDSEKKRVLDFGNNDGLKLELNKTCYPHHPGISEEARQNRRLLMSLFEDERFIVDCHEYWHFDYENAIWAAANGSMVARFGIIKAVTG